MSRKARKKPALPRRKWTRSPVQKPHSTRKGAKGYRRPGAKKSARRQIRNEEQPQD